MPSIADIPKVATPELESVYHFIAGDRVDCTPKFVRPEKESINPPRRSFTASRGVVVRNCPFNRECIVVQDDVTGIEYTWKRDRLKLVHRPIRVVVEVLKRGHNKYVQSARMVQGEPHVLRFIGKDGGDVYGEGITEMFHDLIEKGYEFTVSPIYNEDTP